MQSSVTPLRVLFVAGGFLVVGALVLGALRPDVFAVHFGPIVTTCFRDGQIDAADHEAADSAALAFANGIVGATPMAVYSQMTPEGRRGGPQAFLQLARTLQARGPFAPMSVERTYLVRVQTSPGGVSRVPCRAPDGRTEVVAVSAARTQAHVSISVVSPSRPGEQLAFSVWLTKGGPAWAVMGFSADPSMLAGFTGDDLWRTAQLQRQRGHGLNAALLYATAAKLLVRGPFYQTADRQAFDKDAQSLTPPPELADMPARPWVLDGQAFPVLGVNVVGTADKELMLVIGQPSSTLLGDDAAVAQGHRLIDAFDQTHPEWREAFNDVVARTFAPDRSRSFGVVYDRNKGYLPLPRRAAQRASPPAAARSEG